MKRTASDDIVSINVDIAKLVIYGDVRKLINGERMPSRHGTAINSGRVSEKSKTIKAVIFDSDGVLTDNRVLEGIEGAKPRWRSYYDGQGISLLRAAHIHICFITNESGVAAQAIEGLVERWNSLPSTVSEDNPTGWNTVELFTGRAGAKKVEAAEQWLKGLDLKWADCAVMGDDLVDVPMLKLAGFTAAPSSAERVVLDMVDFICERGGGAGAIRDFANLILEARDIDPTTLPTQ